MDHTARPNSFHSYTPRGKKSPSTSANRLAVTTRKTLAAGYQYVETASKFNEERRGNSAFRILEEQKST
jgi:hypothetical protein